MRYRVLSYKPGSKSARALSDSLGGLQLKTTGKPFRTGSEDVIINWGSSRLPERLVGIPNILNPPEKIRGVANKLEFFKLMAQRAPELVPPHWTKQEDIPSDAYPIVCRTILNGHSGQGIVIARSKNELVPAPLYVKYIPKKQEYRVHVGKVENRKNPDRIISVQRKARSYSVPDDKVNWEIRNHDNGFVYARTNVQPPARVTDAARQALEVMGLDFGAVDVIDNENKKAAYVLEINSAPGLEGSTVDDYTNYFKGNLGVATGLIPKARVTSESDGTWRAEVPYLDEFKRRRYTIDYFETWGEAVQAVNV